MVVDIAKKHEKAKKIFLSAIPQALLKNCWSENIFEGINAECGFGIGYYHVLFPNGLKEIVLAYEDWQNQQMLYLLSNDVKPIKIRQIIAKALEIRIMHIVPKNAALNQSGYFLIPSNIAQGLECAIVTCDLIWKFAGDKSIDFNYYTKRGLLLSVYLAAQTYYFADESLNYQKTKEFIDSSLDSIITIASFKSRIKLPSMEDIPILRLFS